MRVIEGLTPNTPQWEKAMGRANKATLQRLRDKPLTPKERKKLEKPIKGGKNGISNRN